MASEIRIDKISAAGATSDATIESPGGDVVLSAPNGRVKNLNPEAGTIVQVTNAVDRDEHLFTGSNNTWRTDYEPFLAGQITPRFDNSGILVMVTIWFGAGHNQGSVFLRLMRNGAVDNTLNGNPGSYNRYSCFAQARFSLHSHQQYQLYNGSVHGMVFPASIATQTFTIQYRVQSGSRFSVNRDASPASDFESGSHSPVTTSSITLMEIAQ